jgi:RES domain-containing protein
MALNRKPANFIVDKFERSQDTSVMTSNPSFASWMSYWNFARELTARRRYVWSQESKDFLAELMRTASKRVRTLNSGHRLCRAQVAHDYVEERYAGPIPAPAKPERMLPLSDSASDGRANPRGIPCLYLADDRHTAIAEVRPWIGSLVSLAILEIERDLKLVDVRKTSSDNMLYFEGEPSPLERENAVWAHVSKAFREPVLRDDDRAGYAPTQAIAEALRDEGYDGLVYGSGFGQENANFAIFDTACARLIACELHEVRGVKLDHVETASPYFTRNRTGKF